MSKFALFPTFCFGNVLLKKDVGLFPIYLKKHFSEATIFYVPENPAEKICDEYRGLKLVQIGNLNLNGEKRFLKSLFNYFKLFSLIKKQIKKEKITHVMMFHFRRINLVISILLKKVFPALKIYIKLDSSTQGAQKLAKFVSRAKQKKSLRQKLKYEFYKRGFSCVDLWTCENAEGARVLNECDFFCKKVFYAPNGYDDELLFPTDAAQKQKVIITVARLFTEQKNTELLLRVAKRLNFCDWKMKLIGPIEMAGGGV